jgi:D-serine dehydratase
MTDYRVGRGDALEDQFTAAIEKTTSQIPSSAYLGAAVASMAVSVGFKIARKDHLALFVGQWAAPFLLLGIYNKLVKQHGSDSTSTTHSE